MNLPIVICHNTALFAYVLADFLHDHGYPTQACTTSVQAQALLQTTQPALLLLDLWLETPNAGLSVIATVRHSPLTSHTPILIWAAATPLSASTHTYLRTQSCEILDHPFSLEALLAKIQMVLSPPCGNRSAATATCGQPMGRRS